MSEELKAYVPVPYKRNCGSGEGVTHWQGCDCHEENWQKELTRTKEELAKAKEELSFVQEQASKGWWTPKREAEYKCRITEEASLCDRLAVLLTAVEAFGTVSKSLKDAIEELLAEHRRLRGKA